MAGPSFVLLSNKWSSFLYGNLEGLRTDGVLCDVTLQGNDGKTQLAHSCVLASASNVLKSCLVQAPRGHYVVKIPSITSHMWDLLIKFIYQGKVKVTSAEREEMLGAAQMLGLAELQGLCEAPVTGAPVALPQFHQQLPAAATPGPSSSALESHLKQDNNLEIEEDEIFEEQPAGQSGSSKTILESAREKVLNIINNKKEAAGAARYTCTQCGKSFPWGKALHVHELMHKQNKQAKHKCAKCNKICRTYHSLRAHERTHTYQPFKCSICSVGFHFQVNYDLHMKKEHLIQTDETYPCDLCEKEFSAKGLLQRHLSTSHGIKKAARKGKAANSSKKTVKSQPASCCGHCQSNYKSKEDCKEHFQDIHSCVPLFCEACNTAYSTEDELKEHYKVHSNGSDNSVQCKICNVPFKHTFALKCHEAEIHNMNAVPKCDICGTEVKSMRFLAKHMKLHEGQVNENLWRCALCNAEFDNRPDFGMHVAEHRGEKTYNCKYCSKGFTHKGNYTTHVQRHLGIKPFVCQFCNKNFVRKDDLKSHMRVHTGEKPYNCQICQMKFSCISNLREHERAKHNTTFSKRNPNVTVPRQHRQRVKYRAKNVALVNPNPYYQEGHVEQQQVTEDSQQHNVALMIPSGSDNQMFTIQQEGELASEGEYYQVIEDANGVQTLAPIIRASDGVQLLTDTTHKVPDETQPMEQEMTPPPDDKSSIPIYNPSQPENDQAGENFQIKVQIYEDDQANANTEANEDSSSIDKTSEGTAAEEEEGNGGENVAESVSDNRVEIRPEVPATLVLEPDQDLEEGEVLNQEIDM